MRVAHVLRKYWPDQWAGTETALLGLCQGLRRLGTESVVFAPRAELAPSPDPIGDAGFPLRRFSACVPSWGLSDERRHQLLALGGNLMSFNLGAMLRSESELGLVHTHTLGRLGAIGRQAARQRHLPFVVTLHGAVHDLPDELRQLYSCGGRRSWEWGKVFGWLLRSRRLLADADLVFTCNRQAAAALREQHPRQRIVVHRHGVKTSRYLPDRRPDAEKAFPEIAGREILLALGRIDPAKNQHWLVEQVPHLVRHRPGLLLVLAGSATDPGYAETLRRRIRQLGLEHHIFLPGALPPEDPRLIGLCQSARAMLLASRAETFGLVILEAWAAGVPIVASRTAGACELIEDGVTGLLFAQGDHEEFGRALERLRTDPLLGGSLVSEGRRRIRAYDIDTLAREMLGHYEALAAEQKAVGVGRCPARLHDSVPA